MPPSPFFRGETGEQAREIWLVDKAPVVIQKLEAAVQKLDGFMKSQGLDCTPSAVANLKGDEARAAFITHFKEVQRLKTQLDQYTDLTEDNKATIEQVLPEENLRGFKGQYLETAKKLREQQARAATNPAPHPWTSSTSSSSSSPPPSSITTTSWASSPSSRPRGRASRR
jgi:type I restriction enzyme R subunit